MTWVSTACQEGRDADCSGVMPHAFGESRCNCLCHVLREPVEPSDEGAAA